MFREIICLEGLQQAIQLKLFTLDSGINVGVRLLIFEKKIKKKKMKNDRDALIDVKMH